MADALIDPSAWGLGTGALASGHKIPRHVAVIMDGNGRWAKARSMPRAFGHKAGVDALRRTVEAAGDLGIEVLTVYAFSTENWRRPNDEIEALFALLRGYIRTDLDRLDKAGVRICVLGQRGDLPDDILNLIDRAQSQTADNTIMTLVIAFNYGGQAEIAEAAREMARAAQRGELDPETITTATLASFLPTHRWPDPDLVIRTSGEQRLSNFLIWQTAYSEFVVLDTLWPDFGRAGLQAALDEYASRQRRFGGV
jgi:undecaprenyl diphosphate synthase